MKCPECVAEGKKSKVYDHGSGRTLLGFTPYYDEEGVYHRHDPNLVRTWYRCSRGHDFEESKYPECPAEGCDRNQEQ